MMDRKQSPMTLERIDLLNDVGFAWTVREAEWLSNVDLLRKYKELNGDCLVPRGYLPNPRLGSWVREIEASKFITVEATSRTLNTNNQPIVVKFHPFAHR
jgi:hypothetical protein